MDLFHLLLLYIHARIFYKTYDRLLLFLVLLIVYIAQVMFSSFLYSSNAYRDRQYASHKLLSLNSIPHRLYVFNNINSFLALPVPVTNFFNVPGEIML